MKTVLRFRFVWFALLLGATLLSSCKKNVEPVAPADAASQAAGTYTYAELSYNGKTLPASETNLKGKITVTRETASTVTMALDIRSKSNNQEFMVMSVDDIDVQESGSGNLTFIYDGEKIGTLKGKKLTINGEDDDNVPFTISATK